MQKKTLLIAISTVLLCGLIASASASYFVKSWTYPAFNNANFTCYNFADENKGDTSFTATVQNHLTYLKEWSKVMFMNSSDDATRTALILMFTNTSVLKVYYCADTAVGASDVLLATGTWDINSTIVKLSGQKISVYTKTDGWLLKDFGFDQDVCTIAVCGGTGYVSAGYMQVGFNTGAGAMGGTIQQWLPTIISFAMLGMVIGLLKKMT